MPVVLAGLYVQQPWPSEDGDLDAIIITEIGSWPCFTTRSTYPCCLLCDLLKPLVSSGFIFPVMDDGTKPAEK